MSITLDGVKFVKKPKKGIILLVLLGLVEFIFTIILFISLSANIWMPEKMEAMTGVSSILSYQGRLTDANGNPLGGSGTEYCFRFSFYDAPSGGLRVWPSGTPSTMRVNVVNGVFNVGIGDTSAGGDDLSGYDFSSYSAVYLNVEVYTVPTTCTGGNWESLSPRQRIDAVGFSRETFDLYGGEARIGTGAGVAAGSQKLLKLDVVNTAETIGGSCSVNGALWYNSNNTRALICDNGAIRYLGNVADIAGIKESSASETINAGTVVFSNVGGIGISQSTATLATNQTNQTVGTLRFSNLNAFGVSNIGNTAGNTGSQTGTFVLSGQNNITLSQITGAGGVHTIGISAAGGGAGAARDLSLWQHPADLNAGGLGLITNLTAINQIPFLVPVDIPGNLTLKSLGFMASRAAAGSNSFNLQVGVYTYVNSTSVNLLGSCSHSYSGVNTASQSGIRAFWVTCLGTHPQASSLSPGHYLFGFYFSTLGGTASMNYSLIGPLTSTPAVASILGQVFPGADQYSTAATQHYIPMFGRRSASHASPISANYVASHFLGQGSGASMPINPALTVKNW